MMGNNSNKKNITENEAFNKMANHCSRAERSPSEVIRKLCNYNLSDAVVARIMQRLTQEGFLSEKRFAESFVRDKHRFQKWGRAKIEFELRRKGIDSTIISRAVEQISDEETDEILLDLLRKKVRTIKAKSSYERRAKLFRYAAGKGFASGNINTCINLLNKELSDDSLAEEFD